MSVRSHRTVHRMLAWSAAALLGMSPLLITPAAHATIKSWSGKPGTNTVCDIHAQANYGANGDGGQVVTTVGPIAGAGLTCKRIRVTVNYYYAGQPRTATETVDPRVPTNDPDRIIARINFPGTYMNSSHCGLQINRSTYGCHKLSS